MDGISKNRAAMSIYKHSGECSTVTINPLDLVFHLRHDVRRISMRNLGDPNKLLGRPEFVDLVNVVIVKRTKYRDVIEQVSARIMAIQLLEKG